ncbi:heavy metal-associated isoprenylated plant protein 35-like [Nicotiana tabacum]|uniref:Heavy metal-associated isoprenylated plant protein 3-like n=1 Tax=Nicotiana tabacum TaxID=4097 RepID=A0A1S4BF69_TOBAC|nr:PREDICTED: heavy metal-associated isoprenylated plant protein 3-like [Nicotiana tabacum]
MASSPSAAPPPEEQQPPQLPPLHYTTWVLKVSIHCPGCKRKVKKVLQSIEGVYTIDIDPQQQRVIVTGNVDAETLIRKLVKNGRSAELWPKPKPTVKKKKPKKNENSDDDDEPEEDDENNEKTAENSEANMRNNGPQRHGVRFGGVETITLDDRLAPESVAAVERYPAAEQKAGGGGGGGGQGGAKKKKKKKKKSGNSNANANAGSNGAPPSSESEVAKMGTGQVIDQANPGHPFQHPYSNPYDQNPPTYCVPHQSYVVSYNAAHPTISAAPSYYYVPSSPYMQSDLYSKQSAPLESFEILSDENPHACYIM